MNVFASVGGFLFLSLFFVRLVSRGFTLGRVCAIMVSVEREWFEAIFFILLDLSLGGKIGLCSCDWRELRPAFGSSQ